MQVQTISFEEFSKFFEGSTRKGKPVQKAEVRALYDKWLADRQCVLCSEHIAQDKDLLKGMLLIDDKESVNFGGEKGLCRNIFYSLCDECQPRDGETWEQIAQEIEEVIYEQKHNLIKSQDLVQ